MPTLTKETALFKPNQISNDITTAGQKADHYIKAVVNDTGLMVADMRNGSATPETETGRNVLIDSDSVNIRDGQDVLASFGEDVILGKEDSTKMILTAGTGQTYTEAGTYIIDENDNIVAEFGEGTIRLQSNNYEIFTVSSDGAVIVEPFTYMMSLEMYPGHDVRSCSIPEEERKKFVLPTSTIFCVNDVSEDSITFNYGTAETSTLLAGSCTFEVAYDGEYTFEVTLASGVGQVLVSFLPRASYPAPYAVIGTKDEEGSFGGYSLSEGFKSVASGTYAHASGNQCIASGESAHAFGAELIASGDDSCVVGRYNREDTNDKYGFIVGAGRNAGSRSNAFTVGWDGNMELALNTSAASGTVDGDLYAAITALGWGSEVIG